MNKNILIIFIVTILLLLPSCSRSDDPPQDASKNTTLDSIHSEQVNKSEPAELAIDFKTYKRQKLPLVVPVTNSSAIEFLSQLRKIVEDKDLAALTPLLDTSIRSSFGGNSGLADFYEHWALSENPENTLLWEELAEVLSFEAYVDESAGQLILPCYFWTIPIPEDFECFFWYTCEDNVPIYTYPDFKSSILDYYSNELIAYNPELYSMDDEEKWLPVITAEGNAGYVELDKFKCIVDYRLIAAYIDGKWLITSFIAGD